MWRIDNNAKTSMPLPLRGTLLQARCGRRRDLRSFKMGFAPVGLAVSAAFFSAASALDLASALAAARAAAAERSSFSSPRRSNGFLVATPNAISDGAG